MFCAFLTTCVPLVQMINNVFYCYRQIVLFNTIAGKAWQDCRVQVFGVLWSSKPDAEEMEHLFPFFSVLENTVHYAGYRNSLTLIALLLQFSLDRVTEMYHLQLLQALL